MPKKAKVPIFSPVNTMIKNCLKVNIIFHYKNYKRLLSRFPSKSKWNQNRNWNRLSLYEKYLKKKKKRIWKQTETWENKATVAEVVFAGYAKNKLRVGSIEDRNDWVNSSHWRSNTDTFRIWPHLCSQDWQPSVYRREGREEGSEQTWENWSFHSKFGGS